MSFKKTGDAPILGPVSVPIPTQVLPTSPPPPTDPTPDKKPESGVPGNSSR